MQFVLDDHRAQAPAGAAAVLRRQAAGQRVAIPADAAADARPGRDAARRQRGLRAGQEPTAARCKAFGIKPEPMEAIVPSYLWRFRKTGQFRSRAA